MSSHVYEKRLETLLDFNVKKEIVKNSIENTRENIRKKSEVGVLVTDLSSYILLENSSVSQCNEV